MQLKLLADLLIYCFIIEAVVQLLIKGSILNPIRNKLLVFCVTRGYDFIRELITCGYCFSFWVSGCFLLVLWVTGGVPVLFSNQLVNMLSLLFILQRGSNAIHGATDRYFDTHKDMRYNRSQD